MSLWTVTQVRTPDYALLPAPENKYKPLGEIVPEALKQTGGAVSIRNDRDKPQKIGVAPAKDAKYNWVAGVFGNVMLVESRLVQKGQYPDGNCPGEIYTAPARDGSYVELEMLSPMTELSAGQALRDDAIWQIVRLDHPQPSIEKTATAASSAHEAAVRELSR